MSCYETFSNTTLHWKLFQKHFGRTFNHLRCMWKRILSPGKHFQPSLCWWLRKGKSSWQTWRIFSPVIEFSSPEKSRLAHVEVGHLAQHLGWGWGWGCRACSAPGCPSSRNPWWSRSTHQLKDCNPGNLRNLFQFESSLESCQEKKEKKKRKSCLLLDHKLLQLLWSYRKPTILLCHLSVQMQLVKITKVGGQITSVSTWYLVLAIGSSQ